MEKKQKLELTWIGKDKRPRLEPRVLVEDAAKSHHAAARRSDGKDIFDNMLIHGDNLLALKALEQEFAGMVKCIYIDPPYNTGNAFEHYDDGLEHSIWLGLMRERLELLYRLLANEGLFFVQIDDREQAYLKVLLDEIFSRDNFIATLPTIMNLKGNQDQFAFAGTHEYIMVYARKRTCTTVNAYPVSEEEVLRDWEEDEIGLFKKGATLKATGIDAPREKRPSMFYPILIDRTTLTPCLIKQSEYEKIYRSESKSFDDEYLSKLKDEYESKGFSFILPKDDNGQWTRWRWGWNNETFAKIATEVIVVKGKSGYSLYKKQRPEIGDIPSRKPKSIFYKPEYSSGNGTAEIKQVFGNKAFDYPKPEELIADLLTLATNPGDLVLDSFLGSGTTAAVAHKMGRRWIGVELGDHCYTHCKVRLDKVIDGEDLGGITKAVGWKGGGGYRFYELAPTFITKDQWGQEVINRDYNPAMLAEAVCKLEGYVYAPSQDEYFIHGHATEKAFIYVTTNFMRKKNLAAISERIGECRHLLICCKAFDKADVGEFENLTVRKIPEAVLNKCEWGHDDYSLNIANLPMAKEEEDVEQMEFL